MFPDNSSLVDLRPQTAKRASERGSCPDDYILICVECTSAPLPPSLSLSSAAEAAMKISLQPNDPRYRRNPSDRTEQTTETAARPTLFRHRSSKPDHWSVANAE